MLKEYKTVLKQSFVETEEKKSRFIASVKPVKTEDEALEFINELKSKYWDASHNVYSYHIGGKNIVQRFSDAGEPSGTAGLPILEVIKRMEVQDLVVVVTRYFGGTLLGAAGLIRAYSKSASLGIEAAVVVKRLQCRTISLIVEYTMFGKLQNFIASNGYVVKDVVYGQDVEIQVHIPVEQVENFIGQVIELSNDRIVTEVQGETYITVDNQGNLIKD